MSSIYFSLLQRAAIWSPYDPPGGVAVYLTMKFNSLAICFLSFQVVKWQFLFTDFFKWLMEGGRAVSHACTRT